MRRRGAVSTECAAAPGALCFNDLCEVAAWACSVRRTLKVLRRKAYGVDGHADVMPHKQTECAAASGGVCCNDLLRSCGMGMLCPQNLSLGPRLPESIVWHVL